MARYVLAALILKLFSLSKQTKQLYRFLGNTIGARKRAEAGLPASYIDRAIWMVNRFEKYGLMQDGKGRLLELGTGWLPWESTILRLHYDADITLFDVWDNRQFESFKVYFSELKEELKRRPDMFRSSFDGLHKKIEAILSTQSFSELYDLLGFEYVVEPTGMLHNLTGESYDACFSCNVFAHINEEIVPEYIEDLYRVLRPGGYSVQTIDLSDHLAIYDRSVSSKQYLKYRDSVWLWLFQNDVQYINRIQREQWLQLFHRAGFQLMEEETHYHSCDFSVSEDYEHLSRHDIECTTLKLVHRRPFKAFCDR